MSKLNLYEINFTWKNFINQINDISSKSYKDKIKIMNNQIDTQINDEELIEIFTNFYKENINYFIKVMIISNDQYKTSLFFKNVKRLSKLLNINILKDKDPYTQILKLYISIIEERNVPPYKENIRENIINFCNDPQQIFLNNIFVKAIQYEQYGIIDKLKNHVDINSFLNYEKIKKPLHHILKMKGNKLIDYLKYTNSFE